MSDVEPTRAWVKWTIRCLIFVALLMCVGGVIWMYKPTEGVAASLQDLPVGGALDDFPSTGQVPYRKGMPARDFHIVFLVRSDAAALARWVGKHGGEWSEREGDGSDLGLSETALMRVGFPGIDTTDHAFIVEALPGDLWMHGSIDSSTGWCMVFIGEN